MHVRSDVTVHEALTFVPATQSAQGVHDPAFGIVEKFVPAVHGVHALFCVSVHAVDTYVPDAHVVHDAHTGSLASALNVSVAQAANIPMDMIRSIWFLISSRTTCNDGDTVSTFTCS